ncbi:MAG: hypothetical protein ABI591_24295 [Kofleriaceae bacterium]
MKIVRFILCLLALAGCAGSGYGNSNGDGGIGDDAGHGCLTFTITPAHPVAGDHVKATAMAFGGGVVQYHWQLDGVDYTNYEAPDESAIGFDVPLPVSHTVSVDITPSDGCSVYEQTINVGNANGNVVMYRMRVVPPPDLAPPQESLIVVAGGQTSTDRPFYIDPGTQLAGSVVSGATPVAAYVKLTPVVGPAFDLVTAGSFTAQLQLVMHSVLVIPQDNTLAPRVIAWTPGLGPTTFGVDAGSTVSGTVLDRVGAPLANAQVQLVQLGVPSTIATTNGAGAFTAHHTFLAGQTVTATVTPPATSGLARLSASAAFDLTQAMQISYVGSPATCDLAATPVKRSGANQAGAIVTVAGALAGTIGTVTTGAVWANATGSVHVVATANGGGTLPTTLVPRASLAAVIQLAAADFAVAVLDTSACAAQVLDAPARITATGLVLDAGHQPLVGARVEAVPVGVLAMANLIPVQATTSSGGAYSLALASGGHYELRYFDPGGHGAPRDFPDLTAAGVPATTDLGAALAITGLVSVLDNVNPIENASVQLLCSNCTGVAASQPIAQTATDITGNYRIAVPDPGTM